MKIFALLNNTLRITQQSRIKKNIDKMFQITFSSQLILVI